jgi:hypothetical protein
MVGKMKREKIKKLIYEYDMATYMFYVRAGYIPKKR